MGNESAASMNDPNQPTIIGLSPATLEVLAKAKVFYAGEVGVCIPAGVNVPLQVANEINALVVRLRGPIHDSANAVIAAMMEREGVPQPSDQASALV